MHVSLTSLVVSTLPLAHSGSTSSLQVSCCLSVTAYSYPHL